jgi:hypothetical protein
MPDKNFIKAAIKKPGSLRKALGVKEGENIPPKEITSKISSLKKKSEGDKKLTKPESTMLKKLVLAQTLKRLGNKKTKKTLMSATEA